MGVAARHRNIRGDGLVKATTVNTPRFETHHFESSWNRRPRPRPPPPPHADGGLVRAVSSRHPTWLPARVTRTYITPRDKSETTRLRRDGGNSKKYTYPGQSLAEFRSPSTALCNAPFNAPCSPVTPLLLVIAWYCAVLPCALSRRPPQSLHATQQAIVVSARASAPRRAGPGMRFGSRMDTLR